MGIIYAKTYRKYRKQESKTLIVNYRKVIQTDLSIYYRLKLFFVIETQKNEQIAKQNRKLSITIP